jgi:hypothetical protein
MAEIIEREFINNFSKYFLVEKSYFIAIPNLKRRNN